MTLLKAVLFDLDGTLVDTAPDFVVTLNRLLQRHNKAPLNSQLIRTKVSQGARALVTLGFGLQEGDAGFEELRGELLAIYAENLCVESRLFPGIDTLLQEFHSRDILWGVATNKPAQFAEPLMAALDLSSPPAVILCPDHVAKPKPDPESLHLACKTLACDVAECVYVGDHLRDIQCGQRAGMETIAAAYGYLDQEERAQDWQASYLVEHASDIWPILRDGRYSNT